MGAKIDQQTREEEAKRLLDLIKESGAVSHAAFARDCDLPGGKSMLSQHIKSVRPISLECAITYAVTLNKPLAAISPRLSEVIDRLPKQNSNNSGSHARELIASENITQIYKPADQPLVCEIAKLAGTMSRDGQLILLGRVQELVKIYPAESKTVMSSQ